MYHGDHGQASDLSTFDGEKCLNQNPEEIQEKNNWVIVVKHASRVDWCNLFKKILEFSSHAVFPLPECYWLQLFFRPSNCSGYKQGK